MSTIFAKAVPGRQRRAFIRRFERDRSQKTRRTVQIAFLLLNLVIGAQFVLWVRYYESQGGARYFDRPAGVDGWLPIAGLMNLRYFALTHRLPAVHPSAMVLIAAFLLASLLVKKAFCSWLCPVGTVSEYLWKAGRRLFRRRVQVPRWLDLPLRSLKYALLGFFLYIVLAMSAADLGAFLASPFGIVADVKMLNFFRDIGTIGLGVMILLVALSVVIQNFWCRYLCPYGALMGLVSILSPVKIRRDVEACIECGKCSRVCPAHLPVDRLIQIRSAECTGCMECVASCSTENALQLALPPRAVSMQQESRHKAIAERWRGRALHPEIVAALLALIFLGFVGAARVTGHWQTNIPREVYMQLVPNADSIDH